MGRKGKSSNHVEVIDCKFVTRIFSPQDSSVWNFDLLPKPKASAFGDPFFTEI